MEMKRSSSKTEVVGALTGIGSIEQAGVRPSEVLGAGRRAVQPKPRRLREGVRCQCGYKRRQMHAEECEDEAHRENCSLSVPPGPANVCPTRRKPSA